MTEKPVLIHLHLPKAAGQTLDYVLSRKYAKDVLLMDVRTPDLPGISTQQWASVLCVSGHLAYGVHEYLGARPYKYITMLRNPVDRVISLYYFIRRTSHHRDYKAVVEGGSSLREMVENELTFGVTNGQTSRLAGFFEEPATTREHFQSARDNLENHIAAVGLTEDFDRSMLLYQRLMGWPDAYYLTRNTTANRPRRQEVDAGTIRVIEEHNQLDIELYEVARTRFEKDVQAITKAAVFSYRAANRLYRFAAAVRGAARRSRKGNRAVPRKVP